MRSLSIILLFLFCSLAAQKILPFDSLKIKETKGLLADDYGNIYLYKDKDFSFTKYDSLGRQQGKMMLTLPFKIQNVQNPLNIVLFSENAQEIKFIDQNLNEIQKVDLKKFGFVKMAFAEDLQQIWLLDESMKRLVQYNFRDDKIINSYPLGFNFEELKDLLVFENKLYIILKDEFAVYDFKSEKLYSEMLSVPVKLRRENDRIYVISKNGISQFTGDSLKTIFQSQLAQIVDKNSGAYFEVKEGKLYLYQLEK